jgi:DNA modification methylase
MGKRQKQSSSQQEQLLWRPMDNLTDSARPKLVDEEASQKLERYLKDAPISIAGVPQGEDENIKTLSLPPYYTACPSPFLMDNAMEAMENGSLGNAYKGPLTSDVEAGKNDALYFAHYYSTKVPPDAITPYILHYTKPGDLVFDGFCGTGMTGVAAQLCGDPTRAKPSSGPIGKRRAILVDLSPAATFIAAGTNALASLVPFLSNIEHLITEVDQENTELLTTAHIGWPRGTVALYKRKNAEKPPGPSEGRIEYLVWSDVFQCSECSKEIIFWDLVFKGPGMPSPKKNACPACGAEQHINNLERQWIVRYDHELGQTVRQAKQVPVLINYSVGKRRFEKYPDDADLKLIEEIEKHPIIYPVPNVRLPNGFNTQQPLKSHGFSHVHHFFTRRNLTLLCGMWNRILKLTDPLERFCGLYVLTGSIQRVCRLNRYMPNHDRHVGPLSGTLYVSQLTAEIPATNYMRNRIDDLRRCASGPNGTGVYISTQSATDLSNIADAIVDYIFTDPPFGGNLNYSELNVLIEAWIGLQTNSIEEAVVNEVQKKTLGDYQHLMERSFREFFRILKPGQWMTVEFHNSQNSVWISIQEALTVAGFVVADVRTLDKKKGTTKQLSYSSAVKQDLIISCYKPNSGLEERFKLEAGTKDGVWDFVRAHLNQLPVFVSKDGQAEVIAERQNYLLFDRMVAFHVQRGVTVPMSAAEFYAGLDQRFSERDGMYFLPEQVAEYDKKRMTVREVLQLQLFVTDESSAIQWLKQQLIKKPQTFQELHPQFLKEIGGWQKHEKPLELLELMEQNFLRYNGKGEVPNQIHSNLSTNFKELRNLPKDDESLRAKAKDRWYVPDPNKAGDLEKLRERSLLKEFEDYRTSIQKSLKVFRLEAVRTGFKKAWQERDYATIVTVARKIPENVLQEDPKLLMWYDQALTRSGEA